MEPETYSGQFRALLESCGIVHGLFSSWLKGLGEIDDSDLADKHREIQENLPILEY